VVELPTIFLLCVCGKEHNYKIHAKLTVPYIPNCKSLALSRPECCPHSESVHAAFHCPVLEKGNESWVASKQTVKTLSSAPYMFAEDDEYVPFEGSSYKDVQDDNELASAWF